MKEDSTENLPVAEKQVSALLQSLPRVVSTGNFEAKVRSRIANSKAVPQRKWLVPTFAGASLAIMLALGIVFWPSANSRDLAATQPLLEVVDSIPKSPFVESASSNERSVAPAAAVSPKPEFGNVVRKQPSVERAEIRNVPIARRVSRVTEGGSVDRGVTAAPMINANVGSSSPVHLKDYFPMIGVDATFENNAWVVRKVIPDSIADRAGVIDGDVVESIGSVRLAEKTTLNSSELEPKITVLRGSELKTLERGKP